MGNSPLAFRSSRASCPVSSSRAKTMTRDNPTTPRSTGSDADWQMTRAWRRMYLSLIDADTIQARNAVQYAALTFAGLAASYAPDSPHTAEAEEAARDVASCTACGFKALSCALMALRGHSPDPSGDLCDLLRAKHPKPPPTFAKAGQYDRAKGGTYVSRRYPVIGP